MSINNRFTLRYYVCLNRNYHYAVHDFLKTFLEYSYLRLLTYGFSDMRRFRIDIFNFNLGAKYLMVFEFW